MLGLCRLLVRKFKHDPAKIFIEEEILGVVMHHAAGHLKKDAGVLTCKTPPL